MSKFDKSGLYLVLNECSSPVYIPSRNGGFMLDGGTPENPSVVQLYFNEIVEINSVCDLFRHGHLFFEKEYEEAIYEELRIPNWRDILHNSDIEEILLHPTMESLQRILDIKSPTYFDRVRGVYIGLKNGGGNLSQNVVKLMEQRTKEVANGIYATKISVMPKKDPDDVNGEAMAAMQKKMEEMEEQLRSMQKETPAKEVEPEPEPVKAKTTTKKSTAKKTTTASKKK